MAEYSPLTIHPTAPPAATEGPAREKGSSPAGLPGTQGKTDGSQPVSVAEENGAPLLERFLKIPEGQEINFVRLNQMIKTELQNRNYIASVSAFESVLNDFLEQINDSEFLDNSVRFQRLTELVFGKTKKAKRAVEKVVEKIKKQVVRKREAKPIADIDRPATDTVAVAKRQNSAEVLSDEEMFFLMNKL